MKPIDVPHAPDEDGHHDEETCYACAAAQGDILSDCRCGECCRSLILEALPEDALVEPRIAAECERIRDVTDETTGYLLNAPGGPCVSLDRQTNLSGIYEPRPLTCRLFGCQGEFRDELVELGILPPRDAAKP